jgi:zinc transporter ZupT
MNCPSRTDDIDFNPHWNQNPPFLASDLTTCQDLNGIINSRTMKSRSRRSLQQYPDDEYQIGLPDSPARSSHLGLQGWALWLLSVFCTSLIISNIDLLKFSNMVSPSLTSSMDVAGEQTVFIDRCFHSLTKTGHSKTGLIKRSACSNGSPGKSKSYNTPLHVGALFIILFVSTTGCAFPMLVLKFPRLRIPSSFLFSARHFGTGVLIATAFVHLLPTAFISLGDPCLSKFWTTDYQAMPGAIALAAIFFLTVIEMMFSPGRNVCSGGNEGINAIARTKTDHGTLHRHQSEPLPAVRPLPAVIDGASPLRDLGPLYGRSLSFSRTLARMGEETAEFNQIEHANSLQSSKVEQADKPIFNPTSEHSASHILTPEQAHKKAVMQCVLLEMGILFHSIFIGMSLSVSTGSEFIILLIAIVFHRKSALSGSIVRTANSAFHRDIRRACSRRPYRISLMARGRHPALAHGFYIRLHVSHIHPDIPTPTLKTECMSLPDTTQPNHSHQATQSPNPASYHPSSLPFSPFLRTPTNQLTHPLCSTPLGQALGLATHTLYTPSSEVGLLMVGIMNAISSGLLVFASLVELLSEDFLSDESWRILRGKRRVWACVLVFMGAFLMSLVGAWA